MQLPKLSCPVCKGDKFEWGYVTGYATQKLRFAQKGNLLSKLSGQGEKFTTAASCEQCGYILLFRKDKAAYRDPDIKP